MTFRFLISLCIVILVLFYSCKPTETKTEAATGDLAGFELTEIPGSQIKYAVKKNAAGQTVVEGYILEGKRTGQWIEYSPDGELSLIENYVNGKKEGTSLKFALRGQVELRSRYHQGELDGMYTQYKFGKVIEQRPYTMGKLDGTVRTFEDRTWKLKQEVQYKDGKQDGFFRYYDDAGNVSLEYEYKNGEKVSGGIVEKK